jgi:hypothetical protein
MSNQTGWTWAICDPQSGGSEWGDDSEAYHLVKEDAIEAARAMWSDDEDPGALRIVLYRHEDGVCLECDTVHV